MIKVKGYEIERGADLRDSDLRGADLRGANLRDADLTDAYLRGADLTGACLIGAKGCVYVTQRSDGYAFLLSITEDNVVYVVAGCRRMSIAEYRKHTESYRSEKKAKETLDILDYAEVKLKRYMEKV